MSETVWMNNLRRGLLAWVQDHRIESYEDLHLLSHSEAVDQLMAVVELAQQKDIEDQEIGKARVLFWCCPLYKQGHIYVNWSGRVATCPDCGRTNQD